MQGACRARAGQAASLLTGCCLLELLTRKKALFNLEAPEHEKALSLMFLEAMKGQRLDEILDDQVKDSAR